MFVVSMLSLASTGMYMAMMKFQAGNVLGGALTFYLVLTAWITAKRQAPIIRGFDWCALLVAFAVAATDLGLGVQAAMSPTGMKFGYPPGPYFFLGSIALIAVVGDLRMLVAGGISSARRIPRHLWRMCFALFIAAGSIFLARQQLFPAVLRKTGALYLLSLLPLILMTFWLSRLRRINGRKPQPIAPTGDLYLLAVRSQAPARSTGLKASLVDSFPGLAGMAKTR